MANKQYISIIRLFNHCGIPTGADFNLPRAKKQLLAEFNMSQSGFIELEGYTYTRNDVFEEIERANYWQRMEFHNRIWSAPQMLALLEKNIFDAITISEAFQNFWDNKAFDEFFSPYFAGPFNYISRNLLANMRLDDMSALLKYEDFLQPSEREEAFRPMRMFLDENIKLFRNTSGENYKMMRPKMRQWIDERWCNFMNALPVEFYDARVFIVTRMVNIGVAIQKTYRGDCRKMSEQLVLLSDLPESLRGTIMTNHPIYLQPRFAIRFRSGFWIIWVAFMLFRAIASNSCNDTSYKFQNSNSNYLEPANTGLDSSLSRMLKGSAIKSPNIDTNLIHIKLN